MKCDEIINSRIQLHRDFWERRNTTPLIGYSLGNYFVSRRFDAVSHLLGTSGTVGVNDFSVPDFLHDFENAYEKSLTEGGDMVYSATPFTGLPWMEAICGCTVLSQENSFVSRPPAGKDFSEEVRIADNTWIEKYCEFIGYINKNGKGRYQAGQPILRGPGDVLAGLFRSADVICNFFSDPGQAKKRVSEISDIFMGLVNLGLKMTVPFYGGYSMGFYPLWCPGTAIWFQDDFTALLSPDIYGEFFFDVHCKLAGAAEYTMIHIHPDSFYIVDMLLSIGSLNAIQINKDTGGPSVYEMLPLLRKVSEKKNLVIWGDITDDELSLIRTGMNPEGVFVIIHRERNSQ